MRGFLFLAYPGLRTAEHRHADVAAHAELLAAVGQVDLAAIDLTVVRVEDLAAGAFFAVLFQAGYDDQADHRRILERAFAFFARRVLVFVRRAEHFHDLALQGCHSIR